ncbi:hypothetical protein [Megasphaera paucivorans]
MMNEKACIDYSVVSSYLYCHCRNSCRIYPVLTTGGHRMDIIIMCIGIIAIALLGYYVYILMTGDE